MSVAPDIAFAAVLGLAAVFAALVARRASAFACDYLRFAAALYAAQSVANLISAFDSAISFVFLANAVTLLVAAMAPVALAIAMASSFARLPHPAVGASLLVVAAVCGLVAALLDVAPFAFVPLCTSVCIMLAFAARARRTARRPMGQSALYAAIGALALLAGASAYMSGSTTGRTALALFSAAGLMGISLALARDSRKLVQREVVQPLRAALVTRKF